MAQLTCPHCLRQVAVPCGLLPGDPFTCPVCLMELRVPFGVIPEAEYANIEDDMMWDDDEEMGWGPDDD